MTTFPWLTASRRPAWGWGAALLMALVFAAYAPVLRNGFVWDDDSSLTGNHFVQAPDGLRQFWFSTRTPDYWPVTETSFWLEWRLWGDRAAGYHATNLVLHALTAVLLWAALRRLQVPGAYLAAALFAVHPVNVESVAWIAERKNLLGLLFALCALLAFLRTEPARARPAAGSGKWLALSWLAFVLALLSKGSVAPWPLVLLGVIAWHRRPTAADLRRLAPFFGAAIALAAVDVWFQRHGTGEVIREAGLLTRALGAGAAVWFYLGKALWPAHLAFVYPQWEISPQRGLWWLPLLGALAVTGLLAAGGRPARPALFAWGYFGVMLIPVLGFSDVYFMRFSLVADHYQHLAIIGVIAFLAAAWAAWAARSAPLPPGCVAVAAVALLGVLCWRQCRIYRDRETLFRATLRENPGAWLAYTNLGALLTDTGRLQEAADDLRQALRLKPDLPQAELDLGTVLRSLGRRDEAMTHFQAGLRLSPESPGAHYDVGVGFADARRYPEAIAQLAEAIRLRPDYAAAETAWGNALRALGRGAEALPHFERALQLNPAQADAENNLGIALAQSGRLPEALAHLERAAQLQPGAVETESNVGIALAQTGRLAEAIVHFTRAVEAHPANVRLRFNLGNALAQSGRFSEAMAQYAEALRLDPAFSPAREMMRRLASGPPAPRP